MSQRPYMCRAPAAASIQAAPARAWAVQQLSQAPLNARWPGNQPPEAADDESSLVEELCGELLRADGTGLCSGGGSGGNAFAGVCACASWGGGKCCTTAATLAAAAAATVAAVQGRGSITAAAAALSRLFPSASSLVLSLPSGKQIVVLQQRQQPAPAPSGAPAAVSSCHAIAPLQPFAVSAKCTLACPAPAPIGQQLLLAAYARKLGAGLGQVLKDEREAAFDRLSEAVQQCRSLSIEATAYMVPKTACFKQFNNCHALASSQMASGPAAF